MRGEGSERPEKLSEIHKNYILMLIIDSHFNTSNRIILKLKNNKMSRCIEVLFLCSFVEKSYKWKGPKIVYRNNEQDQ